MWVPHRAAGRLLQWCGDGLEGERRLVRSPLPWSSWEATGPALGLGQGDRGTGAVGLGGSLDVEPEEVEKEALGVLSWLPGRRVGPLPALVPDELFIRA